MHPSLYLPPPPLMPMYPPHGSRVTSRQKKLALVIVETIILQIGIFINFIHTTIIHILPRMTSGITFMAYCMPQITANDSPLIFPSLCRAFPWLRTSLLFLISVNN